MIYGTVRGDQVFDPRRSLKWNKPEAGMRATVLTPAGERRPCTITYVAPNGKRFMAERDDGADAEEFWLHKDGVWRQVGRGVDNASVIVGADE